MRTKLFLLLLPFAFMACAPKTTNLVSEKDQEIIKGEIKQVVSIIVKGCEEANFDMAMGPWLNSPDFVYIMNGSILSYQDVVNGMKPMFDALSNQKFTMVSEKFSFLDKSTVLYTTNCKFLMNYKDGHSVLTATRVMLNKICTRTAKTRAIPSLHRDSFLAEATWTLPGCLRRVTQPPHIAGPL